MPRMPTEARVMIPRYIKGHVFEECGRICAHCGTALDFWTNFTLEHVIPLSKGGTNEKKNFVALCETCNQQKANDIIPPMEFFPYLPEAKRKSLQDMFDQYVRSQDWLAKDNLFMTDWFYIHPTRCIKPKNFGAAVYMPTTLRVRKIREEDAFRRLMEYKKLLHRDDKPIFVKSVDEIDTPYYVIEQDGKTVMMFSAFIWQAFDCQDIGEDGEYILQFDFYPSPDLKLTNYTAGPTLYNILISLLKEAQQTLLNGSQGTAIKVTFRTPASAPFAKAVYDFIMKAVPQFDVRVGHCGAINQGRNQVYVFCGYMFQGSMKESKQLDLSHTDMKKAQEAIAKRLESEQRIGPKNHGPGTSS